MTDYKKAISKVKEELKRLAVIQKHNKNSNRENQRAKKTMCSVLNINGTEREDSQWLWCENVNHNQYVTIMCIIYNWMRNRPSHLGSEDAEKEYFRGVDENWKVPSMYGKIKEKMIEEHGDIVEWRI